MGVLDARKLTIEARVREQIAACRDLEQLRDWIVRAATIQRVDELF